jgi:AraC-like DNA-binding protein/nitrate reductase NapE component
MFGQLPFDLMFLMMLYAAGTVMATIACLYLLLRRGNAFAPDVTPPARLRRWTAVFFAVIALGHLWYLPPVMLTSADAILLSLLIGVLLDCLLTVPLAIVILLCMLQDRQRPLWPAWVMMLPTIVGMVYCIVTCSDAILPMVRIYLLLLGIGLIIYMVREVRRYGRWLRDNYVDLEHKEVWQSFLVLAVILLVFSIYASGFVGVTYEYIVQVCGIVMICHLLWRVETLSELKPLSISKEEEDDIAADMEEGDFSDTDSDEIGQLLKEYCIDTQLYLRHDLTVTQLAQAIGTNRTYLRLYFVRQNTTYNTYINDLRIDHFVRLYHEAVAAQRSFTAQQLASESGYRSYSTFSLAFKQRMDQSVSAWMRESF